MRYLDALTPWLVSACAIIGETIVELEESLALLFISLSIDVDP